MTITEIIDLVCQELKIHPEDKRLLGFPRVVSELMHARIIIFKLCDIEEHEIEKVCEALSQLLQISHVKNCCSLNMGRSALEKFYHLINVNIFFTEKYNKCLEQYLALSN